MSKKEIRGAVILTFRNEKRDEKKEKFFHEFIVIIAVYAMKRSAFSSYFQETG
jgi:hypothetical protein